MKRKIFRACGFIGFLLFITACNVNRTNEEKTEELPNIVIIMADDMGYGDLTCYNPESKINTPHMDKLASQGIRLTDAHSPAGICTPSRYGILTGRYCWRTRLKKGVLLGYDEAPLIEKERMTLASLLKQKDYKSACIGKWHLGLNWQTKGGYVLQNDSNKWKGYSGAFRDNEEHIDFSKPISGGPLDLGFDYFFGTLGCSTSDPPYCFIENNHTVGTPSVLSTEELNKLPGFVNGLMVPDWSQEDVDLEFTRKAIDFISGHQKKNTKDPFFLYLALSSPHIPFLPPEFAKGSSSEGPRGDLVTVVDWSVGQLMETLDKYSIADNTLIIVTSDNGARKGANGHKSAWNFKGRKGSAYEGGHRVPFIARWTGKIKPETTSSQVISLTDMLATFATITKTKISSKGGEDSFDISPIFYGNEPENSDESVRIFHSGSKAFAIRKGDWKVILETPDSDVKKFISNIASFEGKGELYNLAADPFEQNNLWDAKHEMVQKLMELL